MVSVYSVAKINAYIRGMFAQDAVLMRVTVRGEVSNCRYQTSGHIYFTLKDSGGETISAVMFASRRKGLSFELRDGQEVEVTGSIEVYVKNGTYAIYASRIERAGLGKLYEEFQKLREKLADMGLFDPMYKQPIPKYARTVGVVTASTGAAIHDIINISSRRNPYVQLYLCPAQVQGKGAAESIVRAIKTLDTYGLDVMIVGRGGGSLEDLWAFNEEIVAKAIFDAKTPIISAVGHETDTTIADLVADLRAPTPSAAAELAVYDVKQFMADLHSREAALMAAENALVAMAREAQAQRSDKMALLSPGRRLNELRRRQDDAGSRLTAAMRTRLAMARSREAAGRKLTASMKARLATARSREAAARRLTTSMKARLAMARSREVSARRLTTSMKARIAMVKPREDKAQRLTSLMHTQIEVLRIVMPCSKGLTEILRRSLEKVKEKRDDGFFDLSIAMHERIDDLKRRQVSDEQLTKLMQDRLSAARNRQSQSGAQQLTRGMSARMKDSRHALALAAERMKAVSPLEKLTSGYVWPLDYDGKHVRSISQVEGGDILNLIWVDGRVTAMVLDKEGCDVKDSVHPE